METQVAKQRSRRISAVTPICSPQGPAPTSPGTRCRAGVCTEPELGQPVTVMVVSVEEVSSSLVREYLSRKGFKRTIACMDEESPRTEESINNRSRLRHILNMEGLYRENKVSVISWSLASVWEGNADGLQQEVAQQPLLVANTANRGNSQAFTARHLLLFGPFETGPHVHSIFPSHRSDVEEASPCHLTYASSVPETDNLSSYNKTEKKTSISESTQRNRTNRIRRGMMAGPIANDIDDEGDLQDLTKVALPKTMAEYSYTGHQMDQHTAMVSDVHQCWGQFLFSCISFCVAVIFVFLQELKVLLLGSSLNCFSVEWRNQGFTFSEAHDLRYGIVQKKGGPCGVLASIQAFVLKKLLFENTENTNEGLARLRPFSNTRRQCLVLAMAEILWRAGEEKQATVAISSGRNNFTPRGHYKSEGVLEKTSMLGCILMTISAILSRSIEKVKEDMDMPTTTLIGAHGYCTQELVNLLLCGRAVSNVFDNDMELDSGNSTMTLLKGIKGHCDVGLLSLFEHYNICKVGAYLKTPRYPIWVVCSESHFSVLFGLQRELLTNPDRSLQFDLYYYDGLANQQEEIRLTVCK
uniref:Ubiquitin carboxyl-terminal hydrolase MINDY n=1 Tax=Echeneis naucrates TaxID=173247 RepID=A0A665WLP7_ECHNA